MEPNKLKPALFGGILLGVLSSIPVLQAGNLCCCLWVLLGGAMAAKLLIDHSPNRPITTGDGAMVGLMAGGVGAAVYLIVGIPLGIVMERLINTRELILKFYERTIDNPALVEQMRRAMEQQQAGETGRMMAVRLVFIVFWLLLMVVFASMGGIIGVALFEKRKGAPPQPTPPASPDGAPGAPLYG